MAKSLCMLCVLATFCALFGPVAEGALAAEMAPVAQASEQAAQAGRLNAVQRVSKREMRKRKRADCERWADEQNLGWIRRRAYVHKCITRFWPWQK